MSKALTISTKIWVFGPCYLVSCYNKLLWLLFWRLGQNALSCLLYVLWLCEQEVPQHKPWNVFKSNSLIHSKQVTSSKPPFSDWIIFHCMATQHFAYHSSIGGHLVCFCASATMNHAARNGEKQHMLNKTNLWIRGWNYGEILLPFLYCTHSF